MSKSPDTVRVRLRILQFLRRIFPSWEWPIARQARIVEHAFDDDLARAGKSAEARMQIEQQRDFEADEYWDELRELRSMKLIRQSRQLHIHVADVKWEWEIMAIGIWITTLKSDCIVLSAMSVAAYGSFGSR
jgi:hypothetical protein